METIEKPAKPRLVRVAGIVLAIVMSVAFFLPMVRFYHITHDLIENGSSLHLQVSRTQMYALIEQGATADDFYVRTYSHSPLRLALGVPDAESPFANAAPATFVLLAVAAAYLLLGFLNVSAKKMIIAGGVGVLALTIFNMHFAFGLYVRNYVLTTGFFWLIIALHVVVAAALFLHAKAGAEVKKIENVTPAYSDLHKLVIASMMLAMAVIIASLAITIFVGGVPALRISFAGIFNNTTAVLFGPAFGGIQRALQDMINHFINPMGAFLWPITVVAFMRGAATGWMWLRVRNVRPQVFSVVYSIVCAVLMAFGLFNLFMQLFFADSAYIAAIAPREGQGLFFSIAYYISSWGLIAAGLIGLVPQFVVRHITRRTNNPQFYHRFIKFLVAVLVPGLIFNTINTLVIFFTAVSPAAFARGFVYFWAPRFFEELLTSTVIVYVMVLLISVYEKAMRRRVVQSESTYDDAQPHVNDMVE